MYEAHFGMHGRPFDSGIAQDVDVFRGRQQEAITAKFKLALAVPDSVVTLTGPAGVGKTTLASAALRTMSTRLALAWLNSVPTNANELLELLLLELGMNAHRTTRIERLQMWRQFLSELGATESRVFVIAERTEDLAPDVLRALDSLTVADTNGCPGANVVLLGRPGLDKMLATPELDSLRQRIRLRQRLEPFSASELTAYLRHRVTSAGGDFDRVFAAGAAAAVHRHSGGVARVANNLCEAALGVAAAERKTALTPDLIDQVAVEMLGVEAPSPTAPAAPRPAAAPVAPEHTVTIASVAVDVTPAKAAAVVAAPKTASAAPRTDAPVAPASVPMTAAPQPVIATAPITAAAKPADATPTPAPVPAAPFANTAAAVARAAAPVARAAPPVTHAAPPVTRAAPQVARAAPQVTHTPTPVAHSTAPVTRAAPPTASPPTPPAAAPIPVAVAPAPIAHNPTPVAHAVAPVTRAAAPVGHAAAPVTHTPAPVARAAPPVTRAAPPVAPAAAPVMRTAAPTASPPTPPVATPSPVAVAPAPVAAAPVPQAAVARPGPIATPPPARIPTSVTAPTPSAAATKTSAPRPLTPDFDATETDLPDVSSFDIPVLTDVVEEPALLAGALVTPAAAPVAPAVKTAVTSPPAARAPAAPAPRPAAQSPARPAAAAAPPPPPPRRLLEPKAAAPAPAPAATVDEDPDVLRQTQTMRAISEAKSIDDFSDSMAETLFGEAELDFLSATLASASGEGEESQAAPTPPSTSSPDDDLMDLFNLGPDAPLELIDDSAAPPNDQRKTAARRGG